MVDAFIKGLAISLLLIFSVGPVIFTIIKQSINHGRRGGFSFIIGVWISDLIWVVLSNGFSEAIKTLLDFKIPIGIAGCIFLIGMGIYFAFIKKVEPRRLQEPVLLAGDEYTPTGRKTNYFAIMSSGFIINTLNPAVISFWVIMAASLASVYSLYDRIIIFSTCLGVNMLADVGKVLGAGYIGKRLSDRVILIINRVSGVLYLIFGFVILAGIIYTLIKD
ncbi:MAG TPA: LysE family transporter [Ferruginibacter sp.]|nr:LysE family transporter [Chitinophagaceae bacterium]MBK9532053.1 LysE family transporter [Chitinophagaceae bacterium]HQW91659.1 LysE family transporter [Ferruginibacter sp.]